MDVPIPVQTHSASTGGNKCNVTLEPTMRKENQSSSIPRFTRSASLRLRGERPLSLNLIGHKSHNGCSRHLCRTTPDTPDVEDSLSTKSYGSCASFMSCEIGTGSQERNSSASLTNKKFVVHCQRHIQTDTKYLTPTQRKDREIRQLKAALIRTSRSCEEKGVEIDRLKSEVDRLRFSNSQSCTSLSQPSESPGVEFRDADFLDSKEDKFLIHNQDGKSVQKNGTCLEDSGILVDMIESTGNSCSEKTIMEENEDGSSFGQTENIFDDYRSCKETQTENKKQLSCSHLYEAKKIDCFSPKWYDEDMYRKENYLRSLSKLENSNFSSYFDEENISMDRSNSIKSKSSTMDFQDMKEKYNDKIENLLLKLSELNSRYIEIRSGYDKACERIRQLDSQVSELRREMAAQEEWHSQMYLKMYRKGQEAAKFEHADEVLEFAHRAPKRVSVPELLQQLHQTEHELEETKQMYRCELYRQAAHTGGDRQAEYTLKFLKDAVYYYLTEKDNKGHLQAIESILGFSDGERITVAKAQRQKKI